MKTARTTLIPEAPVTFFFYFFHTLHPARTTHVPEATVNFFFYFLHSSPPKLAAREKHHPVTQPVTCSWRVLATAYSFFTILWTNYNSLGDSLLIYSLFYGLIIKVTLPQLAYSQLLSHSFIALWTNYTSPCESFLSVPRTVWFFLTICGLKIQ